METKNLEIRTLQKKEAVIRMTKLKLLPEIINQFKNEDVVYYSERVNNNLQAVLYWTSNKPELLNKIKEFEKTTGNLVYHVQLLHTDIGDMYSFFYVSSTIEEWDLDRQDLKNNQSFVYVWNGQIEEYGNIGIEKLMGGIVRTW